MMRLSKTLAFVILLLILLSGITASVSASTWTGNTNIDWGILQIGMELHQDQQHQILILKYPLHQAVAGIRH